MTEKVNISAIADDIEQKVIKARRYLHTNPELSFQEKNTMDYICGYLNDLNLSYVSGIAGTGVAVTIKGEKKDASGRLSKTLLIRADMDALPISEVSDKSYASQNSGIMHACGHDAHTAILLGVCEILNRLKTEFSGCVKLVFQPGEETSGGAEPMISEGILRNPDVDACVALHVDPDLESGTIRVKSGSLYASPDDFKITVIGRGGHGAEPHNCVDPIAVSANVISALMTLVSREINPFDEAVVTIGSIHAGSASNIIPDKVEMTGTARSLTNEVRQYLKQRIGELADGICRAHGAVCEYEFTELFPPLINDDKLAKKLYNSACRSIGADNCIFGGAATMAGEDFSYFSQRVPSVLFKLGCRNERMGIVNPIHHQSFDIDESCLKCGMKVFTGFVLDFLN